MILDTIANYAANSMGHTDYVSPDFERAFQFLKQADWSQIADGKLDIPETDAFVIVASDLGRGKSDSPLEAHRQYVDIQLVIDGKELIGWSPIEACKQVQSDYDSQRDIMFFSDVPQTWLAMRAGQFAVFFPQDAHAPLAGSGPVRKAVAKIPVVK